MMMMMMMMMMWTFTAGPMELVRSGSDAAIIGNRAQVCVCAYQQPVEQPIPDLTFTSVGPSPPPAIHCDHLPTRSFTAHRPPLPPQQPTIFTGLVEMPRAIRSRRRTKYKEMMRRAAPIVCHRPVLLLRRQQLLFAKLAAFL